MKEGYVDIFRTMHPKETDCYTYWSYFRQARQKDVGWRLDYFIVSERFVPNIRTYFRRKNVEGSEYVQIQTIIIFPY